MAKVQHTYAVRLMVEDGGNALKFFRSAKQQEEEEINHLFATCKMIDQRRRVDNDVLPVLSP